MKLNTRNPIYTHEGAKACRLTPEEQLERSVMSCMLWEKEFYEDGKEIAERISELVRKCDPEKVVQIAIKARIVSKLRHAPLLMLNALLPVGGKLVENLAQAIIQRPDELTEILAIYWRNGRQPIPAALKRGLAKSINNFDAYQLAKYNRKGEIKLRDVLRLVHPKPKDEAQGEIFRKIIDGNLEPPNTWEVRLSYGEDKKAVFEDLLRNRKLGYLALLRNLRNMERACVDRDLIIDAISRVGSSVLPYRFIAAAKAAPSFEKYLDDAMARTLECSSKLKGKTVLLVDVSASMGAPISAKSDLTRLDAACGLAILLSNICDDLLIFSFSEKVKLVPSRKGMALRDAIVNSQPMYSTYLGVAVHHANNIKADRLIVITDEQSHDPVPAPSYTGYMLNVASARNGVGYGSWTHVDGFSEGSVEFICHAEL